MLAIRIRQSGVQNELMDTVLHVRYNDTVHDLQQVIRNIMAIDVNRQKLYYAGKELNPDYYLTNYNVNYNDVILLLVKNVCESGNKRKRDDTTEEEVASCNRLIQVQSAYYQSGDLVDVIYKELGAWFEARIVDIFINSNNPKGTSEENFVFEVVMDRNEKTAPIKVNFEDIRPRARHVYEIEELQPEMVVLVNYNIEQPKKTGYWYDFKIATIVNQGKFLQGTLRLGDYHENLHDCKVVFANEVMRIEAPSLLTERHDSNTLAVPLRKLPMYCDVCKDVSGKNCTECSCTVCGEKTYTDRLIICDECECTYHLFCLIPPLTNIPSEPEWYCPDCKNDGNEIVGPGEKLKIGKNVPNGILKDPFQSKQMKDRNDRFGKIPGIRVGTSWASLSQVIEDGVHKGLTDFCASKNGVYSILLNERNLDADNGDEFYFLVFVEYSFLRNGIINTKRLRTALNKAIRTLIKNSNVGTNPAVFGKIDNWKCGKPVRVVRSSVLNQASKFAPQSGYRYDGLYKIQEYFPGIDQFGFPVWRFLLKRDDGIPPPWIASDSCVLGDLSLQKEVKENAFRLSSQLKQLIGSDTSNRKLWSVCMQVIGDGEDSFIQKVKEVFICVCCHDILYQPITTDCKHNICQKCLQKCFNSKMYNCPSCRFELRAVIWRINRFLQAALKILLSDNK